jgi:hypothetical protein
LQGEGQEFESPRLHHRRRQRNRRSRDHPSRTKEFRPACAGHHRAPDPCPPVADGRPPTSGSLDDVRPSGRAVGRSHLRWGRTLTTGYVFGRNEESSISPSSQGNDPDRSQPVTDHLVRGWRGSSYKGHGVDALAPRADEGRGRLRKASGSREQTVIRRCPNGETRLG